MDSPPCSLGLQRAGIDAAVPGVDFLQQDHLDRGRLLVQTTQGACPSRGIVGYDNKVVVLAGVVRIPAPPSFAWVS